MNRNPYNASRPGNLFTGHDRLRRRLIDGMANGTSFAIMGGRRCGKTSLLLQLAKDLEDDTCGHARFLPRFIDIQGEIPHSIADFFAMVSRELVRGTSMGAWVPGGTNQPYQEFLAWARPAAVELSRLHGPDWVCVLMFDELEVAALYLQDEECFHNLRSLLMTSPLSGRLRVVATGVSGLARLITKGSPLNNLEGEDMAVLPTHHVDALISRGFGDSLSAALRESLLELSGGHPWILQCVLGNLWEDREHLDADAIVAAVARFVRNRDDVFVSWIKSFGEAGKAAFGKLSRAAGGMMPTREWRNSIPRNVTPDSVLRTLGYHGVICETDDGRIRTNGSIFRDWFNQNVMLIDEGSTTAEGAPHALIDPLTAPKSKRVFVVFGRDRKLYSAVVRFLRTLKLDPVEWNDALDGTRNASASIKEILDEAFTMAQAVVVLLTPDDEARLRPAFHGPHEPLYETQLTVQPRPNVLFEAGFAMARFPKATILVRFDRTTRLFSDIGGVYLLDLSNEFADREHFVRRLKTCGLDVDDSGTEWHTKERGGDFTAFQ